MNANEFVAQSKTHGWNRKQTRNELYRLNDPALWAQRDEILTALGFAATAQPVAAAQPAVATLVTQPIAPPAPRLGKGQFTLKYPAQDCLTGEQLAAGTIVTGVKLGGEWDFTAEPISYADFANLRDAMLHTFTEDEDPQLDHEDYYLLQEFGTKYPHVRAMIGCDVPGLD